MTKRAASKILSNVWKHCPGLTCGGFFSFTAKQHQEQALKDCLTFPLNQTLGGDLDLLDRPHAKGIHVKRSSFPAGLEKWIYSTQIHSAQSSVVGFCGPLLSLVETERETFCSKTALIDHTYHFKSTVTVNRSLRQSKRYFDHKTAASKKNWNISQWWLQSLWRTQLSDTDKSQTWGELWWARRIILGKRKDGGGASHEAIKTEQEMGEEGVKVWGKGVQPWPLDVMNPAWMCPLFRIYKWRSVPPSESFIHQPRGHWTWSISSPVPHSSSWVYYQFDKSCLDQNAASSKVLAVRSHSMDCTEKTHILSESDLAV